MSSTLYFAFGSNLLAKRIHFQNPLAVRKCIAKLNDYRLDFNRQSEVWGGCSATIVEHPGKHVWGALWEIPTSEIPSLDKQEGVHNNIYKALEVEVVTTTGDLLNCRVYQMINQPKTYEPPSSFPSERRPSRIYLEIILQGAIESGLPSEYVEFLKSFPHNNYSKDPFNLGIKFTITKE